MMCCDRHVTFGRLACPEICRESKTLCTQENGVQPANAILVLLLQERCDVGLRRDCVAWLCNLHQPPETSAVDEVDRSQV